MSAAETVTLIRAAPSGERAGKCAIAVMAKASAPGLVKTRLVPPLSPDEAAQLNSAFLADITDNIALADQRIGIDTYLAFGPSGAAPFFLERFSAEIGLIEVWLPDFGACLLHTVDELLALGYAAACVLNSDSPTLPTAVLIAAADALAQPGDRAVIGPSIDGGYYLLGLKAMHARLFEGITWSTETVARQTLERAGEIGLETTVLTPWYDVDDVEMLRRLATELADAGSCNDLRGYAAPHSTAAMKEVLTRHPALAPLRIISA